MKAKATAFSILKTLLLCFGLSTLGATPALAEEWTASRPLVSMEVVSETNSATYYFYTTAGWGSAGCPSAGWAYFYSTVPGAAEMLAFAIQAKQSSTNVSFLGTCVSGYFQVRAILVS